MELMGNSPHDFVINHSDADLDGLHGFVHRTFNDMDLRYFIKSLRNIYTHHKGLEQIFLKISPTKVHRALFLPLKIYFLSWNTPQELPNTFSDPLKGSAAKRLNMWLRWNCRQDTTGVDLGIWKTIDPRYPILPLRCSLRKRSQKN